MPWPPVFSAKVSQERRTLLVLREQAKVANLHFYILSPKSRDTMQRRGGGVLCKCDLGGWGWGWRVGPWLLPCRPGLGWPLYWLACGGWWQRSCWPILVKCQYICCLPITSPIPGVTRTTATGWTPEPAALDPCCPPPSLSSSLQLSVSWPEKTCEPWTSFATFNILSINKIKGQGSSWLNCAFRDDEAVYWVSKGHYEAVADGNWLYWVSRGHSCLYILHKVEIW